MLTGDAMSEAVGKASSGLGFGSLCGGACWPAGLSAALWPFPGTAAPVP